MTNTEILVTAIAVAMLSGTLAAIVLMLISGTGVVGG